MKSTDILGKDEAEDFLAHETGLKRTTLPEEAREAARLVGYQRLALKMISDKISPKRDSTSPQSWGEVIRTVLSIRREFGI